MQSKLPSAEFYGWAPGEPGSDSPKTKVHAKCAVADGEVAFVTSANLTNAAMESNVELGLLVTGGNVPYSLHRHLNSLVVTNQIVLV